MCDRVEELFIGCDSLNLAAASAHSIATLLHAETPTNGVDVA